MLYVVALETLKLTIYLLQIALIIDGDLMQVAALK